MYGADNNQLLKIGIDEHGGRVAVVGKEWTSGASLGIDENGAGAVIAVGNCGKSVAGFGINEHGGFDYIIDKSGNEKIFD